MNLVYLLVKRRYFRKDLRFLEDRSKDLARVLKPLPWTGKIRGFWMEGEKAPGDIGMEIELLVPEEEKDIFMRKIDSLAKRVYGPGVEIRVTDNPKPYRSYFTIQKKMTNYFKK